MATPATWRSGHQEQSGPRGRRAGRSEVARGLRGRVAEDEQDCSGPRSTWSGGGKVRVCSALPDGVKTVPSTALSSVLLQQDMGTSPCGLVAIQKVPGTQWEGQTQNPHVKRPKACNSMAVLHDAVFWIVLAYLVVPEPGPLGRCAYPAILPRGGKWGGRHWWGAENDSALSLHMKKLGGGQNGSRANRCHLSLCKYQEFYLPLG